MRYAKLIKLGGEYVAAEDADYDDYKGFLTCPECGEPVFLRKAHQRKNAHIPDAFVHHKAVPSIELCELRVSRYSTEYIRGKNAESRGQRLAVLQANLYEYLLNSLIFQYVRTIKIDQKNYTEVARWYNYRSLKSKELAILYRETIRRFSENEDVKKTIYQMHTDFLSSLKSITKFEKFGNEMLLPIGNHFLFRQKQELDEMKQKSALGGKITIEALALLTSMQMKKTQEKIIRLLLDPIFLECLRKLEQKGISPLVYQYNFDKVSTFLDLTEYLEWTKKISVDGYLGTITTILFAYTPWTLLLTEDLQNTAQLKKCLAKQSAGRGFGKTA